MGKESWYEPVIADLAKALIALWLTYCERLLVVTPGLLRKPPPEGVGYNINNNCMWLATVNGYKPSQAATRPPLQIPRAAQHCKADHRGKTSEERGSFFVKPR